MKYTIRVTGLSGFPHFLSGIRTFRTKGGFKKTNGVELTLKLSEAIAYADPGAARCIANLVREKYKKDSEIRVEVHTASEKEIFTAKLKDE